MVSTEIKNLYRDRRWEELRAATEHILSEDDELLLPRLYWLYAQLQLSKVPLSILAGSIDTTTQRVIEMSEPRDNQIVEMSGRLLEEAAEGLQKAGQLELATLFLSRVPTPKESVAEPVEQAPLYDQKELDAPFAKYIVEKQQEATKETKPQKSQEKPEEKVASSFFTTFLIRATAFLLICAFCGGAYWGYQLLTPYPPYPETVSVALGSPEMRLPQLQRIDSNALEAIRYEIDDLFSSAAPQVQQGKALPKQVTRKPKKKTTVVQQVELKPMKRKVALDLSGPIEPDSFPKERRLASKKENGELSATVVKRDFVRGFPGQADTVVAGDYPRVYEVISPTDVLDTASYHGNSMKKLNLGDRVEVVDRQPPWLVIRSKKGKEGYVLSQDLLHVPTEAR